MDVLCKVAVFEGGSPYSLSKRFVEILVIIETLFPFLRLVVSLEYSFKVPRVPGILLWKTLMIIIWPLAFTNLTHTLGMVLFVRR